MDFAENFTVVQVSTGYNSVNTDIALSASERAKLSDPASVGTYNMVWWNDTDYPSNPFGDPNHEIIRVIDFGGTADHIDIQRPASGNNYNGEGSLNVASTKNTSSKTYKMALVFTKKDVVDIRKMFNIGFPAWGVKHKNIVGQNVTTTNGENDLYTCPTGKKAIVLCAVITNNSGSSPNAIAKLKHSGSYYRMSATTAASTGTNTTLSGLMIPLEAGDAFSLNFSAAVALNYFVRVIEFDAFNCPVVFARLFGTAIANGDTTLYTCPAGYTAIPLTPLDVSVANSTGVSKLTYGNETGGSRTLKLNVVPSGGSVSANNLIILTQSASNNAATGIQSPFSLEAGDFVSINCDSNSASQVLTGIFFESILPQ